MKYGAKALLLMVLAAIAVTMGADSQTATVPATQPAVHTVTRFYDIRDLFVNVPDFTAPSLVSSGAGQGQSDGDFNRFPGPTRGEEKDRLIKTITDTIATDSWRDAGGSIGSMSEQSGILTVAQTPENQKLIEEYLAQLRKTYALVPVRIAAHWVITRRTDLAPILSGVDAGGTPSRPAAPDMNKHALLEVDETALNQLHGATHFRGEVLCMSGQRVFVVATGNGGPAAADGSTVSRGGLVLDVTNAVAADRSSVMVTIRSQWAGGMHADSLAPATRPATQPSSGNPDNQGSDSLHDINTTAQLPIGKMILVGGSTVDFQSDAAAGKTESREPLQLYLFMEAGVQ